MLGDRAELTSFGRQEFLAFGREYGIDYRFPDIGGHEAPAGDATIARGRIDETLLPSGFRFTHSDLTIFHSYESISLGHAPLLMVIVLEGRVRLSIGAVQRELGSGMAASLDQAQTDDNIPTLAPFYSLHSKLWTRKFPNAANVLRRCQQYLQPIFLRYEADASLRSLLQQTEKLHASDEKLTGQPGEIRKQAASVASALDQLDANLTKHGANASSSVLAWATRASEALKGLHVGLEAASQRFEGRAFDLDL